MREAFPGRETDGAWLPSFATSLAEAAGIQVRRNPDKMVYYRSPDLTPAKLTVYPAHAAALAPPAWFKGQFVLIGVDVPLQDRHATPFAMLNGSDAGALPGVVMHAHELARLIAGDRIVAPALPAGIVPFLFAGVFCLWIAWRPMPVAIKPVLVIGAIIAVLTAEVLSFAWFGVLLPMVAPAMLLLGVSAFVGFLAWQRDSRERRFIQTAFSQYLSPSVVDEIVREPSALRIGGSERLVTCVFTDLEGFTSFSEKASPEVLASVLNRYLDEICGLFVAHGATIDKLIGDAVVGFFGAPGVQEDQGKRAVVLALAIDKRSRRLREEMAQAGQDIGSTRIGVHRGPAIVGNFGGNRFFNYTAMGDTVNTAARLEGANKFIGTLNCISDQAAKFAEGCLLRPSGALFLKGKNECTRAFEALEDTEANRAMVGEYLEAYRMMADGEPQAEAAFEALAHKYPSDALIAFHRKRLAKGEVGDDIHLAGK